MYYTVEFSFFFFGHWWPPHLEAVPQHGPPTKNALDTPLHDAHHFYSQEWKVMCWSELLCLVCDQQTMWCSFYQQITN